MKNKIVCIVGLGYVGLPLAEAFSKHLKVVGFDIDEEKTNFLASLKPLLKTAYATFLQAKTFTKKHSHCFSFSTGFLFMKKKKCVDVSGIFDEEDAKRKGFYYKRS